MKTFEKAFGIMLAVAVVLKFASWPGGGILATVSLLSLAMVYFYLGFAVFNNIKFRNIFKQQSYLGISAWHIVVSIGTGCGLSVICIGLLFRIQRWPGGNIILIFGWIAVLVVAIVVLIKYLRSKSGFYAAVLTRIIIISGLALLLPFSIYQTRIYLLKKLEFKGKISEIYQEPEQSNSCFVDALTEENGLETMDIGRWPLSCEYANEGDSIIKSRGTLKILIKKPDGNTPVRKPYRRYFYCDAFL